MTETTSTSPAAAPLSTSRSTTEQKTLPTSPAAPTPPPAPASALTTAPRGTPGLSRLAVDRLVLHVPPMSEQEARRFGELVAQALRGWPADLTAAGRLDRVDTTVPAAPSASANGGTAAGGETVETLATRVAAAVVADTVRELS